MEIAKGREKEIKASIPIDVLKSIPNFKSLNLDISELLYYINVMRCLHNARVNYYPNQSIKAQMYFFYPLNDKTIANLDENIQLWQEYCFSKVNKVEFIADENSLFDEDINATIAELNNVYDEYC